MRLPQILSFASLLFTFCLPAADFSYVFVKDDSSLIGGGSLEETLRVAGQFEGQQVLWARIDGKEYVIRAPEVLEKLRVAFRPLESLSARQQRLQVRMRPVEDKVDRLEEEGDRLSDLESRLTPAQQERLREIDEALAELHPQLRGLSHEERRLDEKEEELERVFESELRKLVQREVREGRAERL